MRRIAPDCALIVLAKAPVAGTVKTRLVPLLGAAGAAELQRRLLLQTLAVACACADVHLYCAPDCDHPVFRACAARLPLTLHAQRGADLGERMAHACREQLAAHRSVLLIGTDAPELDDARLLAASGALADGADAVFVPAEDGGYALLGVRRFEPALFDGMPWGTDRVMREARRVAGELGWRCTEIAPVWDVDRPADYARLAARGWLDALPG